MRIELDSFQVRVDGTAVRSSTTIGSVGGYVVVVATTLPDQVVGVTSCYLGALAGAIAASHLRLGPDRQEQLRAEVLPAPTHVGERARACLLDHAAELQQALAELTGAEVRVDVDPGALERAADAWGRPARDN